MDQLREFVITGKASETVQRTTALLEDGTEAEAIMKQALIDTPHRRRNPLTGESGYRYHPIGPSVLGKYSWSSHPEKDG
jgi:hypothetical protein